MCCELYNMPHVMARLNFTEAPLRDAFILSLTLCKCYFSQMQGNHLPLGAITYKGEIHI